MILGSAQYLSLAAIFWILMILPGQAYRNKFKFSAEKD